VFRQIGRLSTGIALTLLTNNLVSGGLTDGINAYDAGRFEQAFDIFSRHASTANPIAMYYLCSLHLSGKGAEQNEYLAFHYCQRAAENEIIEAQFQLGLMYLNAVGITQEDNDKALEWFWKAADSGHPQAKEMFDFIINGDFTFGC
jgi:TPR repeat protein